MAADTISSAAIAGYSTNPPTKPVGGAGAANALLFNDGSATRTAGATTGSIYRLVRVPTNVYVKKVILDAAAAGANAAFSIGVYYSDAPSNGILDGTPVALSGAVVNSKSAIFASAIDPTSALVDLNETNQSGNFDVTHQQKKLWDACGLTSDPGGFFDIVITTGGTDTNGGLVSLKVSYVVE